MMRALGISAAAAAMTTAAIAQVASPFNADDCPEQKVQRWCESKVSEAGWRLKYDSTSPAGIVDAFWHIQVWARGHEAMLCEYRRNRGGIRDNFCESLQEVDR
jgi:hypothetical protein